MNASNIKEDAFKICQEFLGSPWTNINISDFDISPVSGGVSNALYCCSLPSNVVIADPETPRQVLLRLYGPLQEEEHKKVTETTTFILLAERGLGPKLYGVFPNGRLEEYIPSKHLPASDVRKLSTSVARSMAKIHALNLPLSKSPNTWLKHINKWLEDINTSLPVKGLFEDELDFLKKEIENYDSPSVFCHNDLVQGNILLPENSANDLEPNLVLIDFEFGGYNYRSHDIANHFCEWAYDYDVAETPYFTFDPKRYPSEEEKISFIQAYLNQLVREDVLEPSEVDTDARKILKEIEFFSMATQLYWAVWGEKNKHDPKVGIFHQENTKTRMASYWKFKEKYLKDRSTT